ncbi:MAG TPA: endonuclease/exonuclease/phosphatase family protein, partial [Pyrinomonadaceae bacterium]|nr:endonuclease/exonuclease/phosphatase family protein [Pyrinomonadaceae bacterium]
MKLLSYNIRFGGAGREEPLAAVIRDCDPDLVVLQEAVRPEVVERLSELTGLKTWASRRGHSLAFLSRSEVSHHEWHRPRGSRRAFLEIVPAGAGLRVFGVHLTAVHSWWTERMRMREMRALLRGIERHQDGFHVLAGDFNTLAPGELLDTGHLPPRLRPFVWLSGGRVRYRTIQIMLDAGYADAYRALRPKDDPGHTFPTWSPHVRLDFVFLPATHAPRLRDCRVHRAAPVA